MVSKGTLLYGDMGKPDSSGASEYIAKLLHGVTVAHMHHLTTDSYSKHKALGSLYEELGDKVDDLAEAFIGCTGQTLKFGSGQFELGSDPIADVEKLYKYAEENKLLAGTESHLQNQVDEICHLLATTLYKMRQLG